MTMTILDNDYTYKNYIKVSDIMFALSRNYRYLIIGGSKYALEF